MDSGNFIDLVIVFSSSLVIGTIIRYAVPGRIKHGLLLVPAFSICLALIMWEISVWAGVPLEWAQLAWILVLVVTTGATIAFDILLTRRRRASDDNRLAAALAAVRRV